MYVTLSQTHDLVQDLNQMLHNGKTPKVYYTLFEWSNPLTVLNEALKLFDMSAAGCLFEESLLKLRHASVHEKIRDFSKKSAGGAKNLAQMKMISEQEELFIVTKISAKHFPNLARVLEEHQIRCHLFYYEEIKNSSIVDGEVRVINRVGYLNEWPWFLDILYQDMPAEDRKGFGNHQVTGDVNSNGEFYCYQDFSTKYATFTDGYRGVNGYVPMEGKKKYNVTLLGDSRFVNAFSPTEMTLASYLQAALNQKNLHCEVKNLSVCANNVQNEFAMLKSMNVGASDIVICANCTVGTYEGFQPKALDTLMRIKVRMMHDMAEYCRERGAQIFFLHLPHIKDIPNRTPLEDFIARSYNFGAHDPDKLHERMKQYAAACGVTVLDFTDILINNPRTSFFTDAIHLSPEGCRFTANALSEYVRSCIDRDALLFSDEINALVEQGYAAHKNYVVESRFKGLNEYLAKMKKLSEGKPENCGAIVMNCNPFTLGHKYLIETASKQVDHLYILAVEEDRSVFKFNDRIEMMRRGTADLPNVEVIPSGKFVISSLTFPEYFEKSEKPDATVDTSMDLEIFGRYIAPALKIKARFVGEEPIDMVTNQYNRSMEENLPKYGIRFVESPRKESGNAVISASRVRKLLGEKKYDEVKKIVPPTTFDYLINVLGY